jgi:hypothetical protein
MEFLVVICVNFMSEDIILYHLRVIKSIALIKQQKPTAAEAEIQWVLKVIQEDKRPISSLFCGFVPAMTSSACSFCAI